MLIDDPAIQPSRSSAQEQLQKRNRPIPTCGPEVREEGVHVFITFPVAPGVPLQDLIDGAVQILGSGLSQSQRVRQQVAYKVLGEDWRGVESKACMMQCLICNIACVCSPVGAAVPVLLCLCVI